MPRKDKLDRDAAKETQRDRKRDRDGWKASRQAARRNKRRRHEFELGEKF